MTRDEIKRLSSLADSMSQDASLIYLLCDQEVLTSQHKDCADRMKSIARNIMDLHNTLVAISNGWAKNSYGVKIAEPKFRP